ncbi:MAG: tetratricopeptide repeat protein [Elusimicrobia bacterium]|nr:tetratricopeptide repeat protein [Elusimicrobiota bacterium]
MKRFCAAVLFGLICGRPGLAAPTADVHKAAQKQFLQGSLLEHRGDYPGALKAFEAALTIDPRSAYICREAAELALEMGDTDKALALAQRLLDISSGTAPSHFIMGRVLWARDAPAEAQAAFEDALKLDPHSSESILALGSLLAQKSPDQARKLLERTIAENPDEASEAHYQLAKLEFDAGRLPASIRQLQAGLALEPDSLPLHYALAQAYETSASTDAALAEYQLILELDPANVPLIDHVGELLAAKGDSAGARSRFEAAHRLQPSDAFSCQWLAVDAEKEGDWARALDDLKTSAALGEDPALNLRLSYYATQAGRLTDAVRTLEAAHGRWPGNDQIAYFLALGYDDVKESGKSVALLRQVLELKPGWREARFQLGTILEKLNRMAEAEKEFRRLLADQPDDASALNYLGYSLADRGLKLAEAERLIREAVRLAPTNAAYLDSLGWVLHKQGRSTEAVSELRSAAARGPEDSTVWDHLGDASSAAGEPDSAWLAWKRAEALAEGPSAAGRKAASLQRRFSPEDLGELYLEDLAAVHGRAVKLSAVCRVEAEALGRRFAYDGMLTFRGPKELSLDLLGPLFTPLFRVRLGPEGFSMDAIRVEGVDPDLIRQAVDQVFAALREYLSGDLFIVRPARYEKRWWRRGWLKAADRRLDLDAKGMRLAALTPPAGQAAVGFGDFAKVAGHLVPRTISVAGLGYALTIKLDQPKIEFLPEPGTQKR